MRKYWSIDEILIKLPIVNIKLKTPVINIKQARMDAGIGFVEGLQGIKVGFKSFNGSFVGTDLNRNGELVASVRKMDTWETFDLFRLQTVRSLFEAAMESLLEQSCTSILN